MGGIEGGGGDGGVVSIRAKKFMLTYYEIEMSIIYCA